MKPLNSFKYTIFLADDDVYERRLFEYITPLINLPVQVRLFASCEDMLEALTTGYVKPDLLLIEFKMPGISGVDCIREIRNCAKYNSLKLALFTNSAHQATINDAVAAGTDYYILKPHDLQRTIEVIEWLLLHTPAHLQKRESLVFFDENCIYPVTYQAA